MRRPVYEPPMLTDLGTFVGLTQKPSPPGKQGPNHDGSQFLSNFSCVISDDNCKGNPAGGPKK